jgi:hypothetical protein
MKKILGCDAVTSGRNMSYFGATRCTHDNYGIMGHYAASSGNLTRICFYLMCTRICCILRFLVCIVVSCLVCNVVSCLVCIVVVVLCVLL